MTRASSAARRRARATPRSATFGAYVKVKLNQGGTQGRLHSARPRSAPAARARARSRRTGTRRRRRSRSTRKTPRDQRDTLQAQGTVTDETHVEDVYIFVAEPGREDRQPQGVLSLQPRRQGRQDARLRGRSAAVAGLEHGHGRRARERRRAVGQDLLYRDPPDAPRDATAVAVAPVTPRSSGMIGITESPAIRRASIG